MSIWLLKNLKYLWPISITGDNHLLLGLHYLFGPGCRMISSLSFSGGEVSQVYFLQVEGNTDVQVGGHMGRKALLALGSDDNALWL